MIGRSAGCQLVLDDPLVSRRHAQLVVGPEAARLDDLGSVNGVFVNGEAVKGSRLLMPGDRIVIGKQEMILRAQGMVNITADDTHKRFAAETLSLTVTSQVRPNRSLRPELQVSPTV